ncbi:MAG: SufD family Fe-S cluster assembly protein [Candidatus Moranbacteria bacterium]|nr:SufD family Fe-S cluster assembly protein [Candidatus Moranbacteria bacterium]
MQFKNISTDTETHYTLKENEQCVFFLLNRSDDITFELQGTRATAQVFAFFIGTGSEKHTLSISQQHLAPRTTSHVLVKSILHDAAEFSYQGMIHIAEVASLSDASQENRNLLLSKDARAFSKPALEILTNDVRCHHAATTNPLNPETIFFTETRGLTPVQSQALLIGGFFQSSLYTMSTFISSKDTESVLALLKESQTL